LITKNAWLKSYFLNEITEYKVNNKYTK